MVVETGSGRTFAPTCCALAFPTRAVRVTVAVSADERKAGVLPEINAVILRGTAALDGGTLVSSGPVAPSAPPLLYIPRLFHYGRDPFLFTVTDCFFFLATQDSALPCRRVAVDVLPAVVLPTLVAPFNLSTASGALLNGVLAALSGKSTWNSTIGAVYSGLKNLSNAPNNGTAAAQQMSWQVSSSTWLPSWTAASGLQSLSQGSLDAPDGSANSTGGASSVSGSPYHSRLLQARPLSDLSSVANSSACTSNRGLYSWSCKIPQCCPDEISRLADGGACDSGAAWFDDWMLSLGTQISSSAFAATTFVLNASVQLMDSEVSVGGSTVCRPES